MSDEEFDDEEQFLKEIQESEKERPICCFKEKLEDEELIDLVINK